MIESIKNYINARADSIRPCEHEWELLDKVKMSNKLNTDYSWYEYLYRCKKCCESKKISGNN